MTDAERADLEAQLAEARAALHQLQIGGATASIAAPGGRSVTLVPGKIGELRIYIASLEAKLGRRGRVCLRPFF